MPRDAGRGKRWNAGNSGKFNFAGHLPSRAWMGTDG
jgi:hypothetical protein